ncbi:MAG: hypothetical protein AB1457_05880 [Chloroflexota bacterium]
MNDVQKWKTNQRIILGGIVFVLIGIVLVIKAWQEGWFTPADPVDIPSQPVLLYYLTVIVDVNAL